MTAKQILNIDNITNSKLVNQEQARSYRIIGFIFRLIFGSVFVFSSFVKAIDPLGTTYKMLDYCQAMGITQHYYLMLVVSIAMIALEFTIGLSLIFGTKLRVFSWLGLLFMLIMTPLTLWLALKNPISDCGCFGDALVITNWQTFYKNIILLIIITLVIFFERYHRPHFSPLPSWLISGSFFAFSVVTSLYTLNHLPIIDFRPYKIGNSIAEQMEIPEGALQDSVLTTFVYEKNGVEQEFNSLKEAPWNDSTWRFVSSNSVLIKKGFEPPIHDFVVESVESGDITDIMLADERYVFLLVMYDLKRTDTKALRSVNEIYGKLRNNPNVKFYSLTASPLSDIEAFELAHNLDYEFCIVDAIPLKTMVRANPGVVVLKQGVVIDKWNAQDSKKAFKDFCKNNKL